MRIVNLAKYWRKRDWDDQEIAEFMRVRDTLVNAGFSVTTDRGLTDEGDPWFIFLREDSDEVIAHVARIDGQIVADSSALDAPMYGGDLRGVLEWTFRQYALLPMRNGNGDTLLMHPAALLTAFVATAFLQLEHGEQNLALSKAGGMGLFPNDGGDAATAGDDVGAAEPAGPESDGLKGLLARLQHLFGGGPAPTNAAGRAVAVSDSANSTDPNTGPHGTLSALLAALGALQFVDVPTADAAQAHARARVDTGTVPIVYANDLAGAAKAGPDGNGLARAHGAAHGEARNLDAEAESAPSDPELAGGSGAPDSGAAVTGSNAPELAHQTDSVPITFAANALDGAATAGPEPAAVLQRESSAATEGGRSADSADASGSGARSAGDELPGGAIPDTSRQVDRPGDGALSDDDGREAGSMLSLQKLVFGAHDGSDPALSDVREFLDTAGDAPTPMSPSPSSLFGLIARAYDAQEPGAASFVVFDGANIPYSGFAYRSDVIFVEGEAVPESDRQALDEDQTTTIDLAEGGELTLLGVVTLEAATNIDGA